MKGYKAFDKDLKCLDKQYEIGKTYEEKKAELCESGIHFCENPLDVLNYYNLCNSRFAVVEADEVSDEKSGDSKRVAKKLTVMAELSLKGLIDAAFNFLFVKSEIAENVQAASGDSSQLAASGDSSQLAASGDFSQLAASGDFSKLAASGDFSKLAASGDSSQLAASGDFSKLAASGDSSKLAASGDSSQLAASGDFSQLAASGDSSQLAASGDSSQLAASGDFSKLAASGDFSQCEVKGKNSIACNIGVDGLAKASLGGWIVLAEFDEENVVKNIKSAKIDGKKLKADTWYRLFNGKFIEL